MDLKEKVLIVEDEAVLFLEIKTLLEENGYEVIGFAKNGYTKSYDEVKEFLRKEVPDIVLLDIALKGVLNGFDVAKDLLNKENIPFIYLSANSGDVFIDKATETYPKEFVVKTKPFCDKQLLIALRMWLKRKKEGQKDKIWVQETYGVQGEKRENADKVLLSIKDIHYIKSDNKDNNITIGTSVEGKDKAYVLRQTLSYMQSVLPENFIRLNRSDIVNLNKVHKKIRNGNTILTEHKEFKITDTYRAKVKKILDMYFLN